MYFTIPFLPSSYIHIFHSCLDIASIIITLTHIISLLSNLIYFLQEEKLKEYRREKRKDRKRKADSSIDEDAAAGMDPEMAKIMGFSGFSTSKK